MFVVAVRDRKEAKPQAVWRVVWLPHRLSESRCPRPLWHRRQFMCEIPRNVWTVFAVC